ncbi:MAG TPA: cytochrome ubiquinol oxidase subunit I [Myxococcaceae bacterium]|nr:cytochrome ubiquinol oxidase subunit I [Myxococcaceae bacterium]
MSPAKGPLMTDALFWHRLHFGFTVTYHYLFPQLTMGLALLILILKVKAFRSGSALHDEAARFWARVFGVSFAMGVVTGIPLEFQFGTNWSRFSHFAGGVIGQTLAMEGMFAFFLESTFLGLFLYGEKRFGPRMHLASATALWAGSWLSGYFIIATNAFMQHPVGHTVDAAGRLQLADFWAFVLNPWAIWQYLHNMTASVVTASFVVAAVGAFWSLSGRHAQHASLALRTGVVAGLVASCLMVFPTGDRHGKLLAEKQPATLAAMEGLFQSQAGAELAILGQPNVQQRKLENPVVVPGMLSFLVYGSFGSTVTGLDRIPHDQWPDNIELLYYSYHVMAGLGTLFIALMALSAFQLWRGRLEKTRPLLWALMLAMPFPYIATTAGWMTAELGRQPWLVYGLMRTADGTSPRVSAGNTLFTLIGFSGLYLVMGILFLYLVGRDIAHGPGAPPPRVVPAGSPGVVGEAG